GHYFAEGQGWLRADVLILDLPQAGRVGEADSFVHIPGILDSESVENRSNPIAQLRPGRDGGEGSQHQDDSQVGVGPDHYARDVEGAKDQFSKAFIAVGGYPQARCDLGRARNEIEIRQVIEVTVAVDVTRLTRRNFPQTGQKGVSTDRQAEGRHGESTPGHSR